MSTALTAVKHAMHSAQQDAPPVLENPRALHLAFEAFSELSSELTRAYQALEKRVHQLNQEVQQANDQRLRELTEKERIASRLENLLQLLPGGVVVLNSHGQISDCNAAALELLGSPLSGQYWRDVISQRFAPRQDDGHEISLRSGRRISLATRSLDDEPGQIILLTDQTETRKLQQHLARHQRLSAMGKMVSSLAHQIRTPLSAAMLYAGQLETPGLNREQSERIAERLMSRLHNMERQVQDMLIFARGDAMLDARIRLDQLFLETETAAEVLLRTGLCQWTNEAPAAVIECNKEALIGALLNLIENALQAGSGQSRLRINSHLLPAAPAGREGDSAPAWINISVQDNGPGIEPALLEHITEAFFTTRSQGTGLGLAVANVVAKAHGGEFYIESSQQPGKSGTRAGFILPITTA